MPAEVELKLALPAAQVRLIGRHPLLAATTVKGPRTQRLLGIYYDTPDRALSRQGIALRVRKQGRRWVQTLKEEGRVEGGLHQRPEYEAAAPEGKINFSAIAATPVAPVFDDPELVARLAPIFVTDVRRTTRMLHLETGDVELALDRGEVRAGDAVEPICEIELELKTDSAEALFDVALALQDQVRMRIENRSKAERGHALASLAAVAPEKAKAPAIDAGMPVSSAFQAVAFACLAHAQANERGILERSADVEYVHQMRVALRRLRSAFSVFGPVIPRPAYEPALEEIRWIAGSLGPARDWDVFVTETLPPIETAFPGHEGLARVREAAAGLQQEGNRAAFEAVSSERYEKLLLRLSAWLACEKWRSLLPSDALPLLGESLLPFAKRVLTRRHKRVRRRGRNHEQFTPDERHQLRIALKKLRYCTDFFAPLVDSAELRPYAKALANLQEVLGVLNDVAVTTRLLDELKTANPQADLAEGVGIVSGWTTRLARERLDHFADAWEDFGAVKPFWR